MKKIIFFIISIFLLVGCTNNICNDDNNEEKNEPNKEKNSVSITTQQVNNDIFSIVHIDGINDEKLKEYLETYWKYETGEKNVYRYWEPGNELPRKEYPEEYDGIWIDFNKKEIYYYFMRDGRRIKESYNWGENIGYIDSCKFDIDNETYSGEYCKNLELDIDMDEQFWRFKDFFESEFMFLK